MADLHHVSWRDVVLPRELSLIAGLTAAWIACIALRSSGAVDLPPAGALCLVLLRTLWAAVTARIAAVLSES